MMEGAEQGQEAGYYCMAGQPCLPCLGQGFYLKPADCLTRLAPTRSFKQDLVPMLYPNQT